MYNILEARIEFTENKIKKVTVLVDCTSSSSAPLSDVRAISATLNPIGGYTHLKRGVTLSEGVLQEVAAAGFEENNRDKIFPNWKSNYKLKK